MKKRRAPRYVPPGKEFGDAAFDGSGNVDDHDEHLVVTETILHPRLSSQFFRGRPVYIVAHVHSIVGEEDQDIKPMRLTQTKRPVRHKTGGFKFKLGS